MPRSPFSTQATSGGGVIFSTGTPFIETMRPRSIGTRSSVPPGTLSRMKASKPGPSLSRMSTKKKLGARSGRAEVSWRVMLPSISESATRRQAEPEGQDHGRRQRAGPVDVGERQPQRRQTAPAAPSSQATERRIRQRAAP